MVKIIIIIALMLVGLFSVTGARIINIPADYATIQAGIDAAVDGDTVLVAPGTYIGNLVIAEKNILLTSTQAPDTCRIYGYVEIDSLVNDSCKLRGFLIISTSRSPVTVVNSSPVIEANILIGAGALGPSAVRLTNSYGFVRGNIIKDSYDYEGGGICVHGGYPIIENNIIKNNAVAAGDASTRGGGIYFQSGIIRGNVIALNAASSGFGSATGGGIFKDFGEGCEIYNNTILQNNVYSYRGNASCAGICLCLGPSDAINIVENNIIAFNRSGGGVCISNRDSVWLGWDYNLVYGNEDGNFTPGPHDLQVDPMLVDTSSCDYHLQATSPCIDAGDPSFPLDPDSTRADIGAYFFDQAVDIDDPGPNEPYQFALSQNYPNPFNAQTTITYCLDKEATVSMSIYSITGQLMKIMVDKDIQGAGEHRYIWDGTDGIDKPVSTGIYFYELYVDGYKESKAMIMIK